MRLFAGIALAALLLPGITPAQNPAPSLASAVEELTREWFANQTGDLPADELPGRDVLDSDVVEMRDNVIRRISEVLETSDALADGIPDDAANAAAVARLVDAYEGLDDTTTIFTKLALSKAGDPAFQSGWRLCAIRVIAETWLPEAELIQAQRKTSSLPPCESDLGPVQSGMLPLTPPRTEYTPGGKAVVEFAVDASGAVSDPWFVEWSVTPNDNFMLDYVSRSVQAWRFPARENRCRLQRTVRFEVAGSP
jgi:hypothetical protein